MSRRSLCLILFGILSGCGQQADESPGGDGTSGGDDSGDPSGGPDGGGAGEPDGGDGGGDGGGGGSDRSVQVRPGKTDDPELVKRLPVGRSESSASRRVVMRLSPADLPDLAPGDLLSAPAEVQVTTRCDIGQSAAGCGYNPNVAAQIILTGDPGDMDADGQASVALSGKLDLTCTAAEHHCMLVFPTASATRRLEGGAQLPCVAESRCSINLVMWAWHPDARAGDIDEVLVGENEGDFLQNGIILGDKGRLMAIRERGIGADDRSERETSGSGSLGIPTSASPTVLYSHPLKAGGEGLVKGEQFVVEAKVVTAVSDRARFSTRMFLTRDPTARDGKLDKVAPDSIGEHNGTNCTSGTSPCTTRKVSVFRVQEDIAGPVYLNIVGISEVPGPGSATVSVLRADGFLRSTRYAPSLQN